MRKILIVFLGSVLAVVAMSALDLLPTQGQKRSESKEEVATPVQEGVNSAKQKEHSKLYKDYKGVGKLSDLIRQNSSNQELKITVLPGIPEVAPPGQIQESDGFLQKLTASSDAVVIGTVTAKASQITENERFVFTDYSLTVDEVLKDEAANLQPQTEITVTRPGGKILFQGRVISARDKSFCPLAIGGHYLLFLRYIPATGAYQAVNSVSSFELVNGVVKPLTEGPTAKNIGGNVESFLSDVKAAIAATKGQTRGL